MAKTHLREHFLEIGLEIIDLFQHFVKNMMATVIDFGEKQCSFVPDYHVFYDFKFACIVNF